MRLLFLGGGSYIAGMERALFTLMCGLRDRGHEVGAVVSGWNDGEYLGLLEGAKLRALPVKLGRLTRNLPWLLDGLIHYPRAAFELAREVRRFRPDVIVHVDVLTAFSAMLWLPRTPLQALHVHGVPGGDWRIAPGRMALGQMDGFICVSGFIQRKVMELGTKKPVCVARNGVVTRSSNQRMVLATRAIRFGIVGQILARKRHWVLLHALDLLDESDRARCEVLIVGREGGTEADHVRKFIQDRCLGDMVRWTGHLREEDSIYGGLDVLVAPAVDEPFGLTVLEAATYGIPAIAARSGGFPETIVDGQTGILVEPDSPESLARALSQLIREPGLIFELGQRAQQHVAEHFNAGAFAARFEACVFALAQATKGKC